MAAVCVPRLVGGPAGSGGGEAAAAAAPPSLAEAEAATCHYDSWRPVSGRGAPQGGGLRPAERKSRHKSRPFAHPLVAVPAVHAFRDRLPLRHVCVLSRLKATARRGSKRHSQALWRLEESHNMR